MSFDIKKVQEFAELYDKQQQLKDELNEVKEKLAQLEEELTPEFERAGVPNISVNGRTIYIHKQLWAGYKENREDALEALKKAGLDNYVYETYNTHSLSAYFRELYRDHEDEYGFVDDPENILDPELKGAIKLTEKVSLRSRKG